MARPFIIGIAGGSCSGKTTLAQALGRDLGAALVAEDDYYLCATTIAGFDPAAVDFDAPAAKDMARLAADLATLRAGRAIDKPRYCFETHTRRSDPERVEPAPFVICEGILALWDAEVRAQFDLRIWVEAPEALMIERRLARDIAERARTEESVRQQLARFVLPAYRRCAPQQRAAAGIIVPAESAKSDFPATLADVRRQIFDAQRAQTGDDIRNS